MPCMNFVRDAQNGGPYRSTPPLPPLPPYSWTKSIYFQRCSVYPRYVLPHFPPCAQFLFITFYFFHQVHDSPEPASLVLRHQNPRKNLTDSSIKLSLIPGDNFISTEVITLNFTEQQLLIYFTTFTFVLRTYLQVKYQPDDKDDLKSFFLPFASQPVHPRSPL